MCLRPALADPQGGPITGKRGGPMSLAKPAAAWSHVAGKRQARKNWSTNMIYFGHLRRWDPNTLDSGYPPQMLEVMVAT